MRDLEKLIIRLEISLFEAEVRTSYQALDRLLANDFCEITSTGRMYGKAEALSRIPGEQPPLIKAGFFKTNILSESCVLLTYRSIMKKNMGSPVYFMRSSVWQLGREQWQLLFNQGTVCEAFQLD